METNKQNKDLENKTTDTSSTSYKAGDKIERMGEKISQKGYEKTGEAVRNFGDKVEHLQDKDNRDQRRGADNMTEESVKKSA